MTQPGVRVLLHVQATRPEGWASQAGRDSGFKSNHLQSQHPWASLCDCFLISKQGSSTGLKVSEAGTSRVAQLVRA